MKRFTACVCTGIFLALMGCGGGGGSGTTVSPTLPPEPPVEPEPPVVPPPLSVFDCSSDGPHKGAEIKALSAGLFQGTLFDCTTNTAEYVVAIVNEQGDFSIVSSMGQTNAKQLTGSLQTDGVVFLGSGNLYTAQDVSSPLWVDGYSVERTSLDGRWGTESGSYGFFKVDFSSTEGWSFEPPLNTPVTVLRDGHLTTAAWTFEAGGRISAEDSSGCRYTGQMAQSLTQWHIFEIELVLSDCALAGTYSGLAAAASSWDVPFVVMISVEDGAGRALNFMVLGY